MITEMDYNARTGVFTAREFFDLSGKNLIKSLPDAFVCANDNIAIGLIMEMKAHGYECPRDFKVTGFDNLDKAMYYQPQITTVTLNRERIAFQAMQALDQMIRSGKPGEDVHIPAEIVLAESCGCPTSKSVDLRSYMAWQVEDGIRTNERNQEFSTIARSLNPSQPLKNLVDQILRRYAMLDLDGVYIVLDDRLGSETLPQSHYETEHLIVEAARERDRDGQMREITFENTDEMNRHFREIGAGNSLIVIPIHIESNSAGFIVLYNPRFIVTEWYFYEFQDLVLHAFAEWDTNRKLQISLSRLQNVYDRDDLTGLYSKAAFEPKLLPWVWKEIRKERQLAVLFLDIDGFKGINDTMGHAFGDQVLQKVAEALKDASLGKGFSYRYGGDEFILILSTEDPGEAERVKKELSDRLSTEDIFVSIGISYPDFGKIRSDLQQNQLRDRLETYIQKADYEMYGYKRRHHTAR